MTAVVLAQVTDQQITQDHHERLVLEASGGAAGAVVGFVGVVRNHDHGRDVVALEYSSHPSADETIGTIVTEIATAAAGIRAVAVSHRIGDLRVGDAAFVVAVAADHRRAAFETCALLVDEVKARLPIWKHQRFVDGTDEWVGSA